MDMMDMKSYIAKKLNEMRNPESRAFLSEIMGEVFIPMVEYNEQKYADLKQRVYDEIPFQASQYAIYSTVLEREQVEAGHFFLKPMQKTDMNETTHSIKEIQAQLTDSGQYYMGAVFMEADYLHCQQLAATKPEFPGTLVTGQETLTAAFQLVPATRYMDCVAWLNRLFSATQIPWATVNCAYLLKFFDVYLVALNPNQSTSEDTASEDTVLKMQIDYGEYHSFIRQNKIPVWNVEEVQIEINEFSVPMPAGDKINYEHRFDLAELGVEHGYLIDYDYSDIITARREENVLIATSSIEKDAHWTLAKVIKRKDSITDRYNYALLSNRQTDSFAGRFAAHYGKTIKTKLELMRILTSFESGACLEFDSHYITEDQLPAETYEMNPFIQDEIRQIGDQKTMVLCFKTAATETNGQDFLLRDIMSFLVSQVQYSYPEYRMVGVLLP